MTKCELCGRQISNHGPGWRGLDDVTRNWIKAHGFNLGDVTAVCRRLYGRNLMDSIEFIAAAHLSPWGTTRQAARRELARTLQAREQLAELTELFAL